MGGILKFIAENFILSLQMFDNALLNIIVLALIWRLAYIPAWKITNMLYSLKIIKTKDLGKSSHWTLRAFVSYVLFWIIKIPLVLIIFIKNNLFQGILMALFIIGIYYLIKYYKDERKKIFVNH